MKQNPNSDKIARAVRDFYEAHGRAFASTRHSVWDVFRLVGDRVRPGQIVVDVGAGNARLATVLPSGVRYIGIEPSSTLREAAMNVIADHPNTEMIDGGFSTDGTSASSLPMTDASADIVASFAVLHHVPTCEARKRAVKELARITKPGGIAVVTVWNLRSSRLFHFSTWCAAWLRLPMVRGGESGDAWIPWKAEGRYAMRYVHALTLREFRSLFDETDWKIERCEAWGASGPTTILSARNLVIVANRRGIGVEEV